MATSTTQLNVGLSGDIVYTATNSDLQTAATFQTKPNTAYQFLVKGTVYRTDDDSAAGAYYKRALFRTNAAGVVTQVSTTQSVATDLEDKSGWDFLIQIQGTKIAIVVGGEGSPCNWAIGTEIRTIGTTATN